jgi:predicted heme/steroid binding protein
MESKKINQLATSVNPSTSDLAIIGDPITGVSKKITWLQVSSLIGTAANLQQVTDNGSTTTNPITIGGLTISGLSTGVLKSDSGVISSVPFGGANGVATLGGDGKVPSSQLPSYVDDVVEVANYAALPVTGETGKIYITLDNNKVYRWTGSTYVEIAANNAVWGAITGTLSNQTDLQNALDSKIPTSRTLSINGTSYDLSANRTWSVGSVTSVGLTSSASALSITNSPITTSGNIGINFAGSSTQYVAGDGSLVTFPTIVTEAQNLITEVYNETGATLTKGTIVYINGGHGNLPTITKAIATGDSTSAQTYGIVQADITNNNNGYVVATGRISNLNTQSYSTGTQLYLSGSTAGTWTSTKPYAPIHLVYVGIVVRSHPTQGIIEVKIQNGYELDELHNVDAYLPNNNDILSYNTSTSLWEHKQIATTLGYTPLSGSGTSNYLPKYTGANTLNNSIIYDTGTYIGIGTEYPSFKLEVNGTGKFSGQLTLGSTISNGTYTYTLPSATGTLALTSDIPSVSGYVPYTGAGSNVDLGNYTLSAANLYAKAHGGFGSAGQLYLGKGSAFAGVVGYSSIAADEYNKFLFFTGGTTAGNAFFNFNSISVGADRNYTFPNADGTIALTTDIPSVTNFVTLNTMQTITGTKVYNSLQYYNNGLYLKEGVSGNETGYTMLGANTNQLIIGVQGASQTMTFPTSANYTYTFPNATGTIALTSNLSSYVPTSRTLTINGTTYDLSANRSWTVSGSQWTTSGSNIYYNTGNVGIGTTNPTDPFVVQTNTNSQTNVVFKNINTTDTNTRQGLYLTAGACTLSLLAIHNAGTYIQGTAGQPMYLQQSAGGTVNMIIKSTGQVGIGTTDPQRKFVVSNGGADGIELGNEGTAGSIISYNRSTSSWLPLTIQNGGGPVWIGTGSGINAQGLFIGGSASSFFNLYANYSGSSVGFEMTNSANTLKVQFFGSSGNYYFAGSNLSDRRLKSNIIEMNEGLSKIIQLKPSTFTYDKNPDILKGGFIAQEVLEVMPEFVTIPEDENEMMGVDYYGILALAVKAIQEQQKQIEELKSLIKK